MIRSPRRHPSAPLRRFGAWLTAAFVALLLAGCSTAPVLSAGASADATADASPWVPSGDSTEPSLGPAASAAPAATGSALPTASASALDSGGWVAVLPPVKAPAAYLDLGFAGNGDVLAIGTDDVTANPTTKWIARYTLEGNLVSKVNAARRSPAFFGADYADIDPGDDTVLFTDVDFSKGLYHVYRASSTTGATIERLDLHRAMNAIAAAPAGRLFGISATYPTWTDMRPCIVDRLGSGGGIAAGVDYDLKPCETVGHFATPFYFEDPMAIDIDTESQLLVLDWGEAGLRRHSEPAGLGLTVLTPAFGFVRHWHLPTSWQLDDAQLGISAQGWFLSGDAQGRTVIDRPVASQDLRWQLGFRLGLFDRSGAVLATWGLDGDDPGLTSPIAARFDGSGRLWAIDIDEAAKAYVVKRLDQPPG